MLKLGFARCRVVQVAGDPLVVHRARPDELVLQTSRGRS